MKRKMKFEEILEKYNIEYRTEGDHCRPGWVQIDCPYCSKDAQRFRLGYNIESKYVNCWMCGSHNLIQTLMLLTGLRPAQCVKLLDGFSEHVKTNIKTVGKLQYPKGVKPLPHAHRRYLISRNFDPDELVKLWALQGIELASKYSWRIFIPVHYQNNVVSWSTRCISKNPNIIRYIHAPQDKEAEPIKTLLYGEDYVRHAVIITEGFSDVWNIGPGAVATMGVDTTIIQVMKLVRFPVRYICFDNEKEAQKRADKLLDQLSLFPGITKRVVLNADDPGSASQKEIKRLRKMVF